MVFHDGHTCLTNWIGQISLDNVITNFAFQIWLTFATGKLFMTKSIDIRSRCQLDRSGSCVTLGSTLDCLANSASFLLIHFLGIFEILRVATGPNL